MVMPKGLRVLIITLILPIDYLYYNAMLKEKKECSVVEARVRGTPPSLAPLFGGWGKFITSKNSGGHK
jgi:hypothetical protein